MVRKGISGKNDKTAGPILVTENKLVCIAELQVENMELMENEMDRQAGARAQKGLACQTVLCDWQPLKSFKVESELCLNRADCSVKNRLGKGKTRGRETNLEGCWTCLKGEINERK